MESKREADVKRLFVDRTHSETQYSILNPNKLSKKLPAKSFSLGNTDLNFQNISKN
jgi:hypothetical protein